jgi:UDPglucose 6-dehydrogenase
MAKNYSVIGLGKLGASMAAAIAHRGFKVIGVDVNERAVAAVNAGHAPVQETNLESMLGANHERIRATLSHREAILESDVSFVIVPTPSDERGAFTLQYAAWAFREIGRALKEKPGYHIVVLTSTVLPGATRQGLLPLLERESGKKAGKDFGLCYSPEFIALGSVIRDFLNPDFTLVGQFDDRCGKELEACYAEIMENRPPCKRMSLENAELTKIAVNSFVTTKITFANMLMGICERIPGGDIDVVTDALGQDQRIGKKYLRGGLGYGGPCFPRDNVALEFLARALGTEATLSKATDEFNRAYPAVVISRLHEWVRPGQTVAVLGLAYKPGSHVIEESQSIRLVQSLAGLGTRVLAYDPLAGDAARSELAYHGLVLDSLEPCLKQADVVLVTTADPAFCRLTAADFQRRPVTVIDFWRVLKTALSNQSGILYVPYGNNVSREEADQRAAELWGKTGYETGPA